MMTARTASAQPHPYRPPDGAGMVIRKPPNSSSVTIERITVGFVLSTAPILIDPRVARRTSPVDQAARGTIFGIDPAPCQDFLARYGGPGCPQPRDQTPESDRDGPHG